MNKSKWTKKDIELTENKNLDCHNNAYKQDFPHCENYIFY